MQVENHKEEAPFAHYAELFRDLNPAAVTARLSDVRWDGKEFTLSLLGRAFAIAHPDYAIRALDGGALPEGWSFYRYVDGGKVSGTAPSGNVDFYATWIENKEHA